MSRRQFTSSRRTDGRDATSGPQAVPGPDDTGCTILHVDMDAFYASVSLLDHPDLVGTPVIVGGGGTRGVVLSATYEARAFGVHAAMPMARARRLCPQATVIEPHHHRYAEVSRGIMAVFADVTPIVEPLSLDEAFLDVSGARRRLGRPRRIAQLIRDRVFDEQGVSCSVGVAATKFIAKLASGLAKPDGLLVVPREQTLEVLHPLPVAALWGVGERTEETLHRYGLRTVGDIAHTPVDTLRRALGPAAGAQLFDLAWGRDPRPVVPAQSERSIGAEETFAHDVDDPVLIRREILRLSERTAARLRSAAMVGRTVTLKVRFADFTTITRSRTLKESTDVAREVYAVATALYDALGLQRGRIRLVGVRVEGLMAVEHQQRQLALDDKPFGWRDAERAVDRASARFGVGSVRPAALVDPSRHPG
ncbi:DNA polymerase IV [Angustibacter sp. Root456]|uniref:DNA polymerase IV n=1 Tax=Angustibacter sp. Root456 TaxID=1736539 RepID=UPI0006F1C89F|nr:DNA polymerase IV [Angustibacter sp. Root456]KQX63614.1 DNA polymerase IV [Angustibacter sp. Root456]